MGSIGSAAPHAASVARLPDADIELAPLKDTVDISAAEYDQNTSDVGEVVRSMPWFIIPVLVLAVSQA